MPDRRQKLTKAPIPFRMKGMKARFFFSGTAALCAAFLFFSCASVKNSAEQPPHAYITDSAKFNLLPPEYMEGTKEELLRFEGTFGGKSLSLPVFLQADKSGIFMQLLNDFGTGIATISYDGGAVTFSSALFPEHFKAEYIIADIQLAYYSFLKVKESLESISLGFTEEIFCEENGSTRSIRTVSSGKKTVQIFDSRNGFMKVENILRGYSYTLTGASDE